MQHLKKNDRIAFIADLHLGVHQDSHQWHDIVLRYACWLRDALHEEGVRKLVVAGDIFHNRHEIGVNTLHTASKLFHILSDFDITLLVGNHDARLKNSSEINSIALLANSKITVYQDLKVIHAGEKILAFVPWGVPISAVPKCDIIVGHLEITNFRVACNRICDFGEQTESILDKAKLTISGHFHYRDHRKYENGDILYLGSAYELDFGDRDTQKGISILSLDTGDIKFIPNDKSPKHKKILVSDIIEKRHNSKTLQADIHNNIVSLYVDRNISTHAIDLLLAKCTQYKPLQIRTELDIYEKAQLVKDVEALSIDIDTALSEFINLLDIQASKRDVLDKCLDLYKISLTQNE